MESHYGSSEFLASLVTDRGLVAGFLCMLDQSRSVGSFAEVC